MFEWIGGEIDHDELIAAFDRLDNLAYWIDSWDGSRRDLARLKNLTSQLIGRFAGRVGAAPRARRIPTARSRASPRTSWCRARSRAEIAVLKGIVAAIVMSTNARKPIYTQQRGILTDSPTRCWAPPENLDPGFAEDCAAAPDDAARKRVVVDQVATLTDQSAMAWHERLG